MSSGEPRDPLRDLGERLAGAQRTLGDKRKPARGAAGPDANSLAFAWRIGLELVVAIAVGTLLGWAIDRWLGTKPWGMIVLFFLGAAAGMLNVWRAVTGQGMAVGYRRQQDKAAAKNDWDDED